MALDEGCQCAWRCTPDGQFRRANYVAGSAARRAVRLARLGYRGQILLTQSDIDQVQRHLPDGGRLRELGRYSLSAVERSQTIYQIERPGQAITSAPLRFPPAPLTNLPLQPTSFVGREREEAAIGGLLERAPLVTLTGAGGCGKTRLAVHVAADRLERYADEPGIVELAALTDPALVTQAMVSALGLRQEPGVTPLETLLRWLRSRCLLLVLDNCEHLVATCAGSPQPCCVAAHTSACFAPVGRRSKSGERLSIVCRPFHRLDKTYGKRRQT